MQEEIQLMQCSSKPLTWRVSLKKKTKLRISKAFSNFTLRLRSKESGESLLVSLEHKPCTQVYTDS